MLLFIFCFFQLVAQDQNQVGRLDVVKFNSKEDIHRYVDRLSLTMRGVAASDDDIQMVINDTRKINDLIELYRTDDRFAWNLAIHFNKAFRINDINPTAIRNEPQQTDPAGFKYLQHRGMSGEAAELIGNAQTAGPDHINWKYNCIKAQNYTPECAVGADGYVDLTKWSIKEVRPVWHPEMKLNMCGKLSFQNTDGTLECLDPEDPRVCGPKLAFCFIPDNYVVWPTALSPLPNMKDRSKSIFYRFTKGVRFEPGMLAARTIIDRKPWSTIIGTKTVATDAMIYVLKHWAGELVRAMPGIYGLPATEQVQKYGPSGKNSFTRPMVPAPGTNKYFGKDTADLTLNVSDESFKWIDQSTIHAGIMTTPAWNLTRNGARNRVNLAYESLLCRKFVVPDGILPSTSTESDLTKRPYCQECHKTIEPMASFFGYWPNGENNFWRNPARNPSATGKFDGQTGEDVHGLAAMMIKSPDFNECGMVHAFQFVVGREMTFAERKLYVPELLKTYERSNSVWDVYQRLLTSKLFY